MITNHQSGTRIDEVGAGLYRVSTPLPPQVVPGGFTFNQYLLVDEAPLLFHTGPRRMFPLVAEAIRAVLPVERLRYIGLSHFEADECGSLNDFLAVAPEAVPLSGRVAALVSVNDVADRPARALADGEELSLGSHVVTWFDTPHLPHALFTQGGADHVPVTESEVLSPSEAFRAQMDYYSHTRNARGMIERLAATNPRLLACMHGSAFSGDGAALLRALGERLAAAV